ncbi:MAG: ATP-binding cassette domain-containing protein [Anaerolineales bacterium]|nr:ATP-binding cassette domain-containing protein [Anaerolineales bacterium]
MAEIQLQNVSYTFIPTANNIVSRIFNFQRERNLEDLPTLAAAGTQALDNVNLTIPNGQTFAILGPSGCGKSTLLRVVSGLEKTYTGQVLYNREDVREVSPGERYIGIVFQNFALYPNFNNEGNLSFFFKMHKITDEETRKRIEYTSQIMGIGFDELLPRKPGTLSGGQKQRVAIGRAIARAPKLFLFDEPLSNLDAKLRVQTRTEIKRLLRKFEITSLYVTHDQTEAIALADQIVVMHSGRIEQVGTYQELIENPVNIFVAGFIGQPPMNLFTGGSLSSRSLLLDPYIFPLPSQALARLEYEPQITLGVRPEAVSVTAEAQMANGQIQLQAAVESTEADLARRIQTVHLRMGRFLFSGQCPLELKLQPSQPVHVTIPPEALYFFSEKNGKRL